MVHLLWNKGTKVLFFCCRNYRRKIVFCPFLRYDKRGNIGRPIEEIQRRNRMLDLCLLGTGGMMPMPSRFLTAMLARLNGRLALIDCGEGTQVTMKMLG